MGELQATVAAKAAVLAAQEAGSSMAAQQEVRPCRAHTCQPPFLLSSLQLLQMLKLSQSQQACRCSR